MTQTAIIFPGQGAQSVGMAKDVAQASPRAKAVFERANDLLGFDLAGLCFDGPAEELEKTAVQQPAIFTAGVALWEAFVERGGRIDRFCRAGGLSLGEYTALHVAGAMGFDDALRLVRRRGELMQAAAIASPSGMVSLIGGDEQAARDLCDKARGNGVLVVANFNCPGQVVISGSKEACARALALTGEFGCRGVALAVAGAFHSPLMAPAADGLWSVLQETPFENPAIPVISNVTAENHGDAEAIREKLREQLTHPVLWQRCMERMIDEGVSRFVEVGPGRVLSGLMRKIDRRMPVINVSTVKGLDALLEVSDS